MQPDLITVAKGLTSAYLPLSGAIVGEKVWKVLEAGSTTYGPFAHGYTYSAHPLCAAAGLLAAIEFAADPAKRVRFDEPRKIGAQLAAACVEEGVISRAMPHGDILGFAPPLIISRDEIDDVVARVSRAVERVSRRL